MGFYRDTLSIHGDEEGVTFQAVPMVTPPDDDTEMEDVFVDAKLTPHDVSLLIRDLSQALAVHVSRKAMAEQSAELARLREEALAER